MLSDVAWLWKVSGSVSEGHGLRALRRRMAFMVQATRRLDTLRPFIHAKPGSPLQRLIATRPETAGAVVWPYQCLSWDPTSRLERIEGHFKVIEALGAPLDFPTDGALPLLDLGAISTGLRVVLDQPRWFMREGQLAINLFAAEIRIYTVAFSFNYEANGIAAYIGAIQGGNTAGIQDDYKELTKSLHGMRPRDFLVELFRTLCRCLDISRIYAVADTSRQHRSEYFGALKTSTLTLNYDHIWSERGGVKEDGDFFLLSLDAPLKPLDEVPSKKRAMYRRRYELLHDLVRQVRAELVALRAPPPAPAPPLNRH